MTPREPSDGGATPFTRLTSIWSATAHSQGNCQRTARISLRKDSTREKKCKHDRFSLSYVSERLEQVAPSSAHMVAPAGHLCSLWGSHQHARSPETLSPSTTLHKANQANEMQTRPQNPRAQMVGREREGAEMVGNKSRQ